MAKHLLCYGDSNTWGYDPELGERFSRYQRWPGLLQRMLGDRYYVVEEGLCGRTTVFPDPLMNNRCGAEYLRPCLESHAPVDLCILMLGTNDLKTRFGVSAQEIFMGMGMLLDIISTSGAGRRETAPQVLLIAPAPLSERTQFVEFLPDGPGKSQKLAQLYRRLAEERGAAFLDAADYAQTEPSEGVHLTLESHHQLASAVASCITEQLSL